jgi:hypothetical protein
MRKYSEQELNNKIHAFMAHKQEQYPELQLVQSHKREKQRTHKASFWHSLLPIQPHAQF